MSSALRKQGLDRARSKVTPRTVSIAAGYVALQSYAQLLLQASDPSVAEVLMCDSDAAHESKAQQLLEENSQVVSVPTESESLPDQPHVEHNQSFILKSGLWRVFATCDGYDGDCLCILCSPTKRTEVEAALWSYKILLESVVTDANHNTVLRITQTTGYKDILGGWKVFYNDAETGDQEFNEADQQKVVFSCPNVSTTRALVAHAELESIVDRIERLLAESPFKKGAFQLKACDVMFPGLSRNIHYKYHADNPDTPGEPDLTAVAQLSPGKSSMRIATADETADYNLPGDFSLFPSKLFHRTCRTERRTVKVTFFYKASVGKVEEVFRDEDNATTAAEPLEAKKTIQEAGSEPEAGGASGSGTTPGTGEEITVGTLTKVDTTPQPSGADEAAVESTKQKTGAEGDDKLDDAEDNTEVVVPGCAQEQGQVPQVCVDLTEVDTTPQPSGADETEEESTKQETGSEGDDNTAGPMPNDAVPVTTGEEEPACAPEQGQVPQEAEGEEQTPQGTDDTLCGKKGPDGPDTRPSLEADATKTQVYLSSEPSASGTPGEGASVNEDEVKPEVKDEKEVRVKEEKPKQHKKQRQR